MAPSISARAKSIARTARRGGAPTAARSISTASWAPAWSHRVTKQVLPLPPEFIAPQDGAQKQDCERNAAKRWLGRHGAALAHLRPIYLGDDLFACQSIATAIQRRRRQLHPHLQALLASDHHRYLHGAELEEHRQTVCKRGKRTTTIYRWLSGVPLRATADAIAVNWFSIEIRNASGKRTYYNSFVTDLPVTADTVAELAACGRARWKIENETFNVLKTNGYNLEHNFGHGKQTLASVFVTLNLLAFAFHTAAHARHARLAGSRGRLRRRHIASSSTCGPSPLMSCSPIGPTCSTPSSRQPYDHPDHQASPRPAINTSKHGAKNSYNAWI